MQRLHKHESRRNKGLRFFSGNGDVLNQQPNTDRGGLLTACSNLAAAPSMAFEIGTTIGKGLVVVVGGEYEIVWWGH